MKVFSCCLVWLASQILLQTTLRIRRLNCIRVRIFLLNSNTFLHLIVFNNCTLWIQKQHFCRGWRRFQLCATPLLMLQLSAPSWSLLPLCSFSPRGTYKRLKYPLWWRRGEWSPCQTRGEDGRKSQSAHRENTHSFTDILSLLFPPPHSPPAGIKLKSLLCQQRQTNTTVNVVPHWMHDPLCVCMFDARPVPHNVLAASLTVHFHWAIGSHAIEYEMKPPAYVFPTHFCHLFLVALAMLPPFLGLHATYVWQGGGFVYHEGCVSWRCLSLSFSGSRDTNPDASVLTAFLRCKMNQSILEFHQEISSALQHLFPRLLQRHLPLSSLSISQIVRQAIYQQTHRTFKNSCKDVLLTFDKTYMSTVYSQCLRMSCSKCQSQLHDRLLL